MKPFNLEEALNGASLITRNGKHSTNTGLIIDDIFLDNKWLVLKENTSDQIYFSYSGECLFGGQDLDLFMQEDSDLEEKKDNKIKLCDHCHAANQNLLYKIQKMEEKIKFYKDTQTLLKIKIEEIKNICDEEYETIQKETDK